MLSAGRTLAPHCACIPLTQAAASRDVRCSAGVETTTNHNQLAQMMVSIRVGTSTSPPTNGGSAQCETRPYSTNGRSNNLSLRFGLWLTHSAQFLLLGNSQIPQDFALGTLPLGCHLTWDIEDLLNDLKTIVFKRPMFCLEFMR